MTIFDFLAAVAFGSLLAVGLLWPWFEDEKNLPDFD